MENAKIDWAKVAKYLNENYDYREDFTNKEEQDHFEAVIKDAQLIWNTSKEIGNASQFQPTEDELDIKISKMSEKIAQLETKTAEIGESSKEGNTQKKHRFLSFSQRIAASIALLLGIGFGGSSIWINFFQNVEMITLQTEMGERKDFALPDGSKVWLNADSQISYAENFEGDLRKVNLIGEGYFEITPSKEKPFLIETEHVTTKELGTSFNLKAYQEQNDVELSVMEGKVAFSKNETPEENIELKANESAVFSVTQNQFEKVDVNQNTTLWKEGLLILDNATLNEDVIALERWFGVKIELENVEKQGGQDFENTDADFSQMEIEEILEIIAETMDWAYEKQGDVYLLRTR